MVQLMADQKVVMTGSCSAEKRVYRRVDHLVALKVALRESMKVVQTAVKKAE